jgi:hypothetical protein
MRLVDLVEERPRKLALARGEAVVSSHSLTSLASSPTLMTPNGFVLRAQAQRHFAGRALQVLDIELPAARAR